MDEHVNPTIATVLHRCWPVPIQRDTQPTEAQRLAADLYNMQHKGRLCDAESAQAIFRELDALDYGLAWWLCIVVLATMAAIVMVVTA